MPGASGVLCVLSLPARVLSHDFDMAPGALNDPEKYAIRAAVQVRELPSVAHCMQQCLGLYHSRTCSKTVVPRLHPGSCQPAPWQL